LKVSVVTISYNQAPFLESCLDSIASQQGPWEHIIVDPGSTDGSREIIERRRSQFSHIEFSPDKGPADGLNKGFSKASGDLFYYLNSDDLVAPGAFSEVRAMLNEQPKVDVLSGHASVIDEAGSIIRRVYSDPITRHRLAHGGGIRIQPATFIRRVAYECTAGFNVDNRSNWDGELIVDLFLNGAKFAVSDRIWGGYRLHSESITASGKLNDQINLWSLRSHEKLMGRSPSLLYGAFRQLYRLDRVLRHPDAIISKISGRNVYGARRP
jgi:glycosyltransferase involved in cell wall biosynthesis